MKFTKMLRGVALVFWVIAGFGHAGQERSGGAGVSYLGQRWTLAEVAEKVRLTPPQQFERALKRPSDFSGRPVWGLHYDDLPELVSLVGVLLDLKALDLDLAALAVDSLVIREGRSYRFELAPSEVEDERVRKIYSGLQVPGVDLGLGHSWEVLALTDTERGETSLMEAYFSIPSLEARMALLYHEMLWALDPSLNYSFIAKAEQRFYRFLLNRRRQLENKGAVVSDPTVAWDLAQAARKLRHLR